MPANKRQHFVPKAHLRPFAVDGERKAINLFNIASGRAIPNVSIRDQCARDYLYGDPAQMRLEELLTMLEGNYAKAVRSAESGRPLSDGAIVTLKTFTIIQYQRTEMAMARHQDAYKLVREASIEGFGRYAQEHFDQVDIGDREIIRDSVVTGMKLRPLMLDLKPVLIVNRSDAEFVTSDDPAAFANRFHVQKLGASNFGFGNTGAMWFLPLTPRIVFACYDGGTYAADKDDGQKIYVDKAADVAALNELQLIRTGQNVYFSSWDTRAAIEAGMEAVSDRRKRKRVHVGVMVLDDRYPSMERYRPATAEDRRTPTAKLISVSFVQPEPIHWFRKLPFRARIKTINTRTMAGHIRSREIMEWMRQESSERPSAGKALKGAGGIPTSGQR